LPLRAKHGHEDISSFDYDKTSWEEVKSSYRKMGLTMPCCSAKAIPKTSKLGNYYFAHSIKGDCTSVAESQEHLYVKGVVAKAAKEAGWNVKTEWQGASSSGEKWIADVYCVKGNSQVALEIQLSRQTSEETFSRQNRYKNSKVRCAWLASSTVFNKSYIHHNKETPFFLISKPVVGKIPSVVDFDMTLPVFVNRLLSGNVKWIEEPWIYDIHYIEDLCWKCKKANKQIFGYSHELYNTQAKTVPNASTILSEVHDILSNEELKFLGLNTIGEFGDLKGNAPNFPFCNACIHCGAPQNNYYLMEKKRRNPENKFSIEYQSKSLFFTGDWVLNTKP